MSIFPISVLKEQFCMYIMTSLKRIPVFLSLLAAHESGECTVSQSDVTYFVVFLLKGIIFSMAYSK